MKLSTLLRFFDGITQPQQLSAEIRDEILEYQTKLKKRGSGVPIQVVDDASFIFTVKHFATLARAFQNKELTTYEVNYLADVLELAESAESLEFESEVLREFIFVLANPEINGTISHERVQEMLDSFGEEQS